MDKTEIAVCALCGEPMPPGEEMFNYHGYSGPCPKPPLQKPTKADREASLLSTIKELMEALEKWVEFTDSKNGWGTVHMETTLFFEQAHTLQVGSLGVLSRAKSLMEQKP